MGSWVISTVLEDSEKNRKLIEAAIKHDWLLFQGAQMKAPNLSEWIRFLINLRLTWISQEK